MSEIEELEYKRAAFQILSSILGELVPDFWKPASINGNKKGALVDTLSTNSRRWPVSGY
jgi:hypothetical protein